jgi:hypothetical protein
MEASGKDTKQTTGVTDKPGGGRGEDTGGVVVEALVVGVVGNGLA